MPALARPTGLSTKVQQLANQPAGQGLGMRKPQEVTGAAGSTDMDPETDWAVVDTTAAAETLALPSTDNLFPFKIYRITNSGTGGNDVTLSPAPVPAPATIADGITKAVAYDGTTWRVVSVS